MVSLRELFLSNAFAIFSCLFAFSLSFCCHSEIETQRLACFFFDKTSSNNSDSIVLPGLPSVWAKGFFNETIYVDGTKADGFFKVTKMRGESSGLIRRKIIENYQTSKEMALNFCRRGISQAFPTNSANKILIKMGTKSSFLSINSSPPTFPHTNANNEHIDKIVVFGDSLSDQGNLKNWLRIYPKPPYFAGRFSNGLVWGDYLRITSHTSMQNWAVAGSITSPHYSLNFDKEEFLNAFVSQAINQISGSVDNQIQRYKKQALKKGTISDSEHTLFSIWVGGNDYLAYLDSPVEIDTFIDHPEDKRSGHKIAIRRITRNIIANIKRLYDVGGKKFLVANLPDLGKLPYLGKISNYHQNSTEPQSQKTLKLAAVLSEITKIHNQTLNKQLDRFIDTHKDATVIKFDAFGSLQGVIESKNLRDKRITFNYDLDETLRKPIKYKKKKIQINLPCHVRDSTNPTVCTNPDRTIYWDDVHPSSFGHCLLAYGIHKELAGHHLLEETSLEKYLTLCRPGLIAKNISINFTPY